MNTCLTGMKKQLRSVLPCWLFPITVINITMLNVHLLESHLNYTFRISRFKSNLFIYLASFTIINVSRCFRESRDLQQATVERKKQKTLTEPGSYGGWGVGGQTRRRMGRTDRRESWHTEMQMFIHSIWQTSVERAKSSPKKSSTSILTNEVRAAIWPHL